MQKFTKCHYLFFISSGWRSKYQQNFQINELGSLVSTNITICVPRNVARTTCGGYNKIIRLNDRGLL